MPATAHSPHEQLQHSHASHSLPTPQLHPLHPCHHQKEYCEGNCIVACGCNRQNRSYCLWAYCKEALKKKESTLPDAEKKHGKELTLFHAIHSNLLPLLAT